MEKLININEANLSEESAIAICENVISKVESGYVDGLKVHIIGKYLKMLGELIADESKGQAIDEAEMYNKDQRHAYGVSFEIKSSPNFYDWEKDSVYKSINDDLKNRKRLLDAALKGLNPVDKETGELISKVPIKTSGQTTLAVSFKHGGIKRLKRLIQD